MAHSLATVTLPDFEQEKIRWKTDQQTNAKLRFYFSEEDLVSTVVIPEFPTFTFYLVKYKEWEREISKIVVFEGNNRVAYITFDEFELFVLYVIPWHRRKGVAKKLLSMIPKNLVFWVIPFELCFGYEATLTNQQLNDFYRKYYHEI